MLKNKFMPAIALILLFISLLVGVIQLFMLRFQAGDIYPPYSSLRSDPLGTRALYESLENFNEISVQRNFHMLHSLKVGPDGVLFYLGVDIPGHDLIPEKISQDLDRMTESGGRLVISYLPVNKKDDNACGCEKEDGGADQQGSEPDKVNQGLNRKLDETPITETEDDSENSKDDSPKEDASDGKYVSIKEHWGLRYSYNHNLPAKDQDQKYLTFEATSVRPDLPTVISWHTNLYFELFDDSWQTLYAVDNKPVIIERSMGDGTLVLCADSYFFK